MTLLHVTSLITFRSCLTFERNFDVFSGGGMYIHASITHKQVSDAVGFKGVSVFSADVTDFMVMLVILHNDICQTSDK